jgi:hypothetical protein
MIDDRFACQSCKAVPSTDAFSDSAYKLVSRYRIGYER